MTIEQAISLVDKLKPNQYLPVLKIKWLSKLDGQIFKEVFATHEDNPIIAFDGYTEDDKEKELLVPYPFDEDIYNYFLQAQIDKENGETAKYNQSITLYNNAFLAFQNYWNRTHMPIAISKRFVF
jgi:hypothetical protein